MGLSDLMKKVDGFAEAQGELLEILRSINENIERMALVLENNAATSPKKLRRTV